MSHSGIGSSTSATSGGTASTASMLINQFGALLILLICSALIAFIPLSLLHYVYRKKRRRIREQEQYQNGPTKAGKYHNHHRRNGAPKPIPNVEFPDDEPDDEAESTNIVKKTRNVEPKGNSLFGLGRLLGDTGNQGSQYTNRHCHVGSSLHQASEIALASTLAIPNMLLELIRSLDGGLLLAALFLILMPQLRSSFESFMRAHVYTTKLRLPTSLKMVDPTGPTTLYHSLNSTYDPTGSQSNITNFLTRQIATIQRHNEQQDANALKQSSPIPLVELILCLAFFALHFTEEFVQLCLRYPKYFWACNSSIVYSSSDGTCEFTSLDYRISRTKRFLIDCSRKTSSQSSPRASTPLSSSVQNNLKHNPFHSHEQQQQQYNLLFHHSQDTNTHYYKQRNVEPTVNNGNNHSAGAPSSANDNLSHNDTGVKSNSNSTNTQVKSVGSDLSKVDGSDSPNVQQNDHLDQSLPLPSPPPLPPPNRQPQNSYHHYQQDEPDIVCDHHQLDDSLQSVDNSELFQPNYRHNQQPLHQPQCQFHGYNQQRQQFLKNPELFPQQQQQQQPNDCEPSSMLSTCSSIHLPSYYWQQMPTNTVPLPPPPGSAIRPALVPQLYSGSSSSGTKTNAGSSGHLHSHQQQYLLRKTPLPYYSAADLAEESQLHPNPSHLHPHSHHFPHHHHPDCPMLAASNNHHQTNSENDPNLTKVDNTFDTDDNKPPADDEELENGNEFMSSMPPPPTPLSEAVAEFQNQNHDLHPPPPTDSYYPYHPYPHPAHHHHYPDGMAFASCCCKHQHFPVDAYNFQQYGPNPMQHQPCPPPSGMPLFAFGSIGGGSGGVGLPHTPHSSSSTTATSPTPIFTKIFLPYTTIATSTPALYLCEGVLIAIQPTSSMLWLMLSVVLLHKLVTGLLVAFELHEKTTGNQRHLPGPTSVLFVALPTLGYLLVMLMNGIVVWRKHQPLITSSLIPNSGTGTVSSSQSTTTTTSHSAQSPLLSVTVDPLSIETAVLKVILFAIASATLLHLVLLIIQRNLIQFQPQLQLRKQQPQQTASQHHPNQHNHHQNQQPRRQFVPFRGGAPMRANHLNHNNNQPLARGSFSIPGGFPVSAATTASAATSSNRSTTSTMESNCRKNSQDHLFPVRPPTAEETTVFDPEIVTNPPRYGVLHHFTMYTGFIVVLMAVAFLNMANLNKV